jgi:integrase
VREKETKTGQRRKVALDPETLALLTQHRELWEQRCADLGCTLDDDTFVFSPAPDGSAPYAPRSLTQRYRRMATKLMLRSTRLHSLRHYSATELVAAGVDLRTVAGRLGHGSGGATTLTVYGAWVDEADRRAATTIVNVMPKPIPVRCPRSPYKQIAEAIRDEFASSANYRVDVE